MENSVETIHSVAPTHTVANSATAVMLAALEMAEEDDSDDFAAEAKPHTSDGLRKVMRNALFS